MTKVSSLDKLGGGIDPSTLVGITDQFLGSKILRFTQEDNYYTPPLISKESHDGGANIWKDQHELSLEVRKSFWFA